MKSHGKPKKNSENKVEIFVFSSKFIVEFLINYNGNGNLNDFLKREILEFLIIYENQTDLNIWM